MAKDGTSRGGRRVRAGGKPKATFEKIDEGKTASIMDLADLQGECFTDMAKLNGENIPEPSAYLSAMQKDGKPLGADIIYKETYSWLKERGCHNHVNPRLLESYSQAFARFIQCEEAISEYGLLGQHPTTGMATANPFVAMSQSYQKQANNLWYEIFDIVKQNCTTAFTGNPQEDMMEKLLNGKV